MGIWRGVRKQQRGSRTLLPELAAYLPQRFLATGFAPRSLFFRPRVLNQAGTSSGPAQHRARAAQGDGGF